MNLAGGRKILFVSVHPPGRVPSQRFRFEQYVEFLEEHGFATTFAPVIRADEYGLVYGSGHLLRKGQIGLRGLASRVRDVLRGSQYDLVVVQREAIQLGTAVFERAFGRARAGLVFDFDDAIWLPNVSDANSGLAWLKRPGKTAKIIAAADIVFAGNDYLREYALQFNPTVKLVPTTIDTELYQRAAEPRQGDQVCVGWTGSMTTIEYFKLVIPVLKRLKQRFGKRVRFEVVGDRRYRDRDLEIEGRAWNPRTEVSDLSRFDIGIMPMPDDKWARGKCGLKGLQYMALEIPAVLSDVGVNSMIIDDGRNGFLSATSDEWFTKLSQLIESEKLRRRLGAAARETVVREYSVESQKWRYLDYLRAAAA
jgi:glycosyltransferase involved in cell wall biosynthesis